MSPRFYDWDKILSMLNITNAHLMFISPYEDGRRVYYHENKIIKIMIDTGGTNSKAQRRQDLEGEFTILADCINISGIPKPISLKKIDAAQILELTYFQGIDFLTYLAKRQHLPVKLLFWDLPILLLRLSARSISHNDLRMENILISEDNNLHLIDFDQASKTTISDALLRNFGLLKRGLVNISFLTLIKSLIKIKLGHKNVNRMKRILGKKVILSLAIPAVPENASTKLRQLHYAWRIAKDSNASSPGIPVAYYALTVDGIHFPGERPWEVRWSTLRTITDFKGKRTLELGCNMGLLSCFLLSEEQVEAALAVDIDVGILNAARHVASAYGVNPTFLQVDLDRDITWEEELRSFSPDIVFALNVLNWIKDKARLLHFLGDFKELIFEGHDSFELERQRLKAVGFNDFKIISLTERQRPLIFCRK